MKTTYEKLEELLRMALAQIAVLEARTVEEVVGRESYWLARLFPIELPSSYLKTCAHSAGTREHSMVST